MHRDGSALVGKPTTHSRRAFAVFHGLFALVDPHTIPFVDERDPDVRSWFLPENLDTAAAAVARRRQEVAKAPKRGRGHERRRVAEGLLTGGLLGSLPAFPDA